MTTAPFALAGSGDADASCSPKAIKVKAELPCETYTSPSPKAHATTIIGEHFSAALKTSTGADKVQATGALDSTTTASAHANDVHDIRLQLFDLPSAWSTSPAHAAYTCQRRLLLVFQEQELQAQAKIMLEDQSSDANAKTHRVVIAAAQLYEYRPLSKEDRPRLLYLSKLDTTGLATPRHAQRHVVRALVQAVLAYAGESASMWHVPYRLHVLSTANPEYLFPRSAELSGKRVLEGRPLIYWWKQALSASSLFASTLSITRHWFIPGLDINDVPRQHRLEGGPDAPTWHYGHSYEGKAQALDHIPTFLPDDAVSACLRRAVAERSGDGAGNVRTPASGTSGNAITVDAFFHGMLERASEFRNSNVGVFVVEMHVRDALDVVSDKDDEHDETPNVQLLHMIEQMLNIVDTKDKSSDKPLTFHTINDAHSSSAKLCAILEKSAVKPMLVQARIPSPAHAPATQDASGKHGNPPPPAVNMLTVKRRRKE